VSIFEIHSGDGGKKSWISFGTNKESMIFRAETELESQEWLCCLRAITGNIQPVPGLVPQRYANIEARAVLLNYPNIAGDTPLHILARTAVANKLSAEDDEKMDLLHTAQWLMHSECDPFALNKEGVTAADISSDSELHDWLKQMTAQLVKNDITSHSLPLLQPPLHIPGYSYVSLLLHKHTYSDTAR